MASTTHDVPIRGEVRLTINDPDVLERVVGRDGHEWRENLYDLTTVEDVLEHLAVNAVRNGIGQVNRLDGWADMADDAATMAVQRVEADE